MYCTSAACRNQVPVQVAAGGAILLELLVYRHETIPRAYETYGEAVEAGEGQRGWLPSPVPPSARRIEILSNIDTNAAWVRFNADLNDLRAMAVAIGTPLRFVASRSVTAGK